MGGFVFLENHSVYSLCEGTIFISELAAHAKSRGYRYLSICDTNGFYGIINFIQACEKQDLKPVICARLINISFSAIVVARSMKGYSRICSLITKIRLDTGFNIRNELLKDASCDPPGGCPRDYFVITGDRGVLSQKKAGIFAEINVLKKNYARDYSYAKSAGIEPVLIYPVYFLKKEDLHIHTLLRAIQQNKKLSALLPDEVQSNNSYPVDESEIRSRYSFMEDAIKNTTLIAERSCFDFSAGRAILPRYGDDSFHRLKALCLKNLKKRYTEVTPRIAERLEKELEIIRRKGFADYFLVVHDIVKRSAFTCGRGSAAASIVSYLLFITHVDPVRHNLFFERFMNKARPDPPDIDVDFPWDTRDEILDYIFKKYSSENSAMVSNHVTFSVRSSVREVAKVYGLPENEISRITKNIRYYYSRTTDDFENYSINSGVAPGGKPSPLMSRIYRDAVEINGRPRYLSVHCGGVVITPGPVHSYIPVEKAPKGVNLIQLEKDQAEDFGFVKIDVLGNRSLAVVRDTLELVEAHYGTVIRYQDLNPLDDEKTIKMLAEGNTIGVFYVESPAMRQLQKKTRRGDYEHLVIHSSIIRPAANMYIREYVERLHGKPYRPPLPEMGRILSETYGIMCYQEDITKIALEIAGFPMAEACELRKVIPSKRKIERKLQLKDLFYKNCIKRKIDPEIIDRIWNMIESFSGYSFCKPHSASYALLSFKACYLKAHYPAEFMGAVLKNQGGYYSPLAYLSEARRMGLKTEKPDINKSRNEYFGDRDTVYIGFMQIKNLSKEIVRRLVDERDRAGLYSGLLDFMDRTGASVTDTVLLIKAECFRNIERYNQPQLLYMAHTFRNAGEKAERRNPGSIFPGERALTPPPLKDIPRIRKVKNEIELYGFVVSFQPMKLWRHKIRGCNVISADRLHGFLGKQVKVAGILITAKTVPTKNDELMQFISFEDETAIFETVFFPRVYKKYALKLHYQKAYILHGKVDSEFGVISLNVSDIEEI
jgi:DNA-directed DNA polymerase III PolC